MSEMEPSAALAPCATRQNGEMAGLDLTEQSASFVASKDSTSDMAYLDPAEKPAPFITSQADASDTAALDLTDQPFPFIASKFRASDMAVLEPPAPFVASHAGAGDMAALDLTGEPAPSGRQTGGDPTSTQPTGDEPSDDQPTHSDPTSDINAEKLIAEIQKCPFIYGRDYIEYSVEMERQKKWQNICERLFPEWNTFSPRKMNEIAIRVQNNWAKLREPIFKNHAEKCRRTQKEVGGVKSNSHSGFHGYNTKKNAQMEEFDLKFVDGIFSNCAGVINQQLFTASQLVIDKIVRERYDKQPLPEEEIQVDIQINPTAMPTTSAHNFKVPFLNVEPAIPSTSAQNYVPSPNVDPATPSTSTHNNHPGNMAYNQSPASFDYSRVSQMFPFKPGEYEYISFLKSIQPSTSAHTIPDTNYEYIPPETGLYKNPETAYNLYTLLTHLNYDQQRDVWPKLVDVIAEGARNEPKKIKILQNELIDDEHGRHFVAVTGPEIVLQEQYSETEQLFVQETLAEPELVAQETVAASDLTGQETLAQPEPEEEQDPIYPCTYGRPTNAQGEIIYPETDHEDLDEE